MIRWTYLAGAALATAALSAVGTASAGAAAQCPISYGIHDSAKPNKLFLYYPTAPDAAFPEFTIGAAPTSPAARFDAADLPSYTGSTAALRNASTDIVTDDYCEFNVQVRPTTTAPGSIFPRRNVVAVGTDPSGDAFGQAERVDTGDATNVDFARVWGGEYQSLFGGAGGVLNGANSTLARWARSIGGTAAHEAGHNYGLSHETGVAAGEDALTRHLMPAGTALSGEDRAGFRRHFSDDSFSKLASNVGLSIQTMHNWDLVNPNASTASRLRMEFLSPNPSAILSWAYLGNRSPWGTPTITGPLGTQGFKGQTLNRYRLEWSTGQAWSGGSPGQVPGGGTFHVGATLSGVDFDQPDAVIITKLQLLNATGTPLALQPRLPGYDAGTLDVHDGTLDLQFFNTLSRTQPLQLRNVIVRDLPRVVSLNAMMPGVDQLFDPFGEPVAPWRGSVKNVLREPAAIEPAASLPVEVARLSQGRHILQQVARNCANGDNHTGGPDVAKCVPGVNVDLFPATTMYVTCTAVTPNMKHWDRQLKKYVIGDVQTRVYLQVAGRHPDFNRNGIDDTIDISTGRSIDDNRDGVPDEAQR
jgi:hypothetical protein